MDGRALFCFVEIVGDHALEKFARIRAAHAQDVSVEEITGAASEATQNGASSFGIVNSGEPYNGAAVLLDPRSGEVLTFVSLPAYDPNDKGHFHVGTAEWWVIMKGQIRHNIETVGDFTSSEGDVVYVPASTWHATRFAGPGPSCRLAEDHDVRRERHRVHGANPREHRLEPPSGGGISGRRSPGWW